MDLIKNTIIHGDCIEVMNSLPEKSIDLIFADPPYNLQLQNDLHRPNLSLVNGVNDNWDKFNSFEEYDEFTYNWLKASKRILKNNGSIWVIGSYHNIFRVGKILQDLDYWILNDVIWIKRNPMPNFRGVRFTNAHETLIWAAASKDAKYTFNHHAMKEINEGKQMRSDWWLISLATGKERIRDENGMKAHSTQKPEDLLFRVILSSSKPGDIILDPFFGSGTTGVVAKKLHRNWIGIEKEEEYIRLAERRISSIAPTLFTEDLFDVRSEKQLLPKVSFSNLLENGLILPGQKIFFDKQESLFAIVKPDSRLEAYDKFVGSIHQVGSHFSNGSPCNGWEHWYILTEDKFMILDELRRESIRKGFIND